jgi:hypothetical protein
MPHSRIEKKRVERPRGMRRGTRIQMAVPLEHEPRVAVAQLLRDDHRRDTGGDHQRRSRMPKVVEREAVETSASDCRPKYASHEVVLAPHCACRRRENEIEGAA